jgi:hypothetical protein
MRVFGLAFVAACLFSGFAFAQTPVAAPSLPADPPVAEQATKTDPDEPTVTARLLQSEARVGDALSLVITAVAPDRVPVNLPANLDLSPFELVDRSESEKPLGDGKRQRQFTFRIAAFETGALTVPAVTLTYLAKQGSVRSVSTDALSITIKSVLANEPDPAVKPDAAPVAVMEEVRWPLYVAGGLLTALLGALMGSMLLSRWRRRAKIVYVPPPRPAHEVALEKLERLGAGLTQSDDMRPFYFELSETLREYFGARYAFDSLELTTDELLFELRRFGRKPLIISEVEGWLSSCDLVKFARVSPTEEDSRAALETGIKFVVTTVPPPQPVVATNEEANAHG